MNAASRKQLHFDYDREIKHILIVGLGGTGSQLARSIARMIYDMRSRRLATPELSFIDPDAVSMKNVGRQMFAAADVGHNKAEVLARRFNAALGLEISWLPESFDADRHIGTESWQGRSFLVCGAVDNHLARRALAKRDGVLWIDCGNHFSAGQVVIGTTKDRLVVRKELKHAKSSAEINVLPNAAALFPALLEPEATTEPEVSCADLVALGEQHLLINDLIAGVAAGYVYKLLHRQPITTFISYVDLDLMNVRSVPITAENLRPFLQPARVDREERAG